MTTHEWADVLAGLSDPAEVRDCLLMLADDLPDDQGEVLRKLAVRKEGVRPARNDGRGWLNERVWISVEHTCTDSDDPCKLPADLLAILRGSADRTGRYETYWMCRYYPDDGAAWLALLEALPAYAAAKVRV